MVTLRTAVEQYTLSKKKIKEIILEKQLIGWNMTVLQNQLIAMVRSTGYRNNIHVVSVKLRGYFNYTVILDIQEN